MKRRRPEPKNPSRKLRRAYRVATEMQEPARGFEPISAVVERLRMQAEQKRRDEEK